MPILLCGRSSQKDRVLGRPAFYRLCDPRLIVAAKTVDWRPAVAPIQTPQVKSGLYDRHVIGSSSFLTKELQVCNHMLDRDSLRVVLSTESLQHGEGDFGCN